MPPVRGAVRVGPAGLTGQVSARDRSSAAMPATQARRLQRRNGFDDATIRSILDAQLAIAEKIRRADRVVWNEGSPEVLRWQVQRLVQSLIPA